MPTGPKPTAVDVADETPVKPDADEQSFPISDLTTRSSEFLGVPSHVIAGAFHGTADTKKVTISEARSRIKDWEKGVDATTVPEEA